MNKVDIKAKVRSTAELRRKCVKEFVQNVKKRYKWKKQDLVDISNVSYSSINRVLNEEAVGADTYMKLSSGIMDELNAELDMDLLTQMVFTAMIEGKSLALSFVPDEEKDKAENVVLKFNSRKRW